MLLSLQIMAMLTWKEMPTLKICRWPTVQNVVILIYLATAANEAFFVIVTVTWAFSL